VDVTQCSQQLNADELSTIVSQILAVNTGGVIVCLTLIALYTLLLLLLLLLFIALPIRGVVFNVCP
jgi:hypothetical protein